MKKIKKILATLLVMTMMLSMVACNKGDKKASDGGGKESGDKKIFDITYLTPSTASQFWTYIEIGMKNAIKDMEEKEGVKINYSMVGPAEESQTEEYVTAFEQTIAKQPDAIVTATLAIDATVPKAQEATQNDIIVNFVNCGLGVGDDGAHGETYNQFYFCSNDTIGEMAAEAFIKTMQEKEMDLETGVLGINTNVENEALNHRIDGFRNYMGKNAPKLTLTDTYYNGNAVEKAQSNAENIISTYGKDLIGMYSGNNITGDGVSLAIRSANLGDKFVSVAVDSDDTEIAALKDGFLDAIVVQDAYIQGYKCMENAILTLMNGSNPEKEKQVNCPPVVITAENMETEEMQDLLDPTRLQK